VNAAKKMTAGRTWKTRMNPIDPDSPGLAASGPNKNTDALFDALSNASTAAFSQSSSRGKEVTGK
jgi:hypothetical protein